MLKFLNVCYYLFLQSKLKTRYRTFDTHLIFRGRTLILRENNILGSAYMNKFPSLESLLTGKKDKTDRRVGRPSYTYYL